jgi:hypothetical protein
MIPFDVFMCTCSKRGCFNCGNAVAGGFCLRVLLCLQVDVTQLWAWWQRRASTDARPSSPWRCSCSTGSGFHCHTCCLCRSQPRPSLESLRTSSCPSSVSSATARRAHSRTRNLLMTAPRRRHVLIICLKFDHSICMHCMHACILSLSFSFTLRYRHQNHKRGTAHMHCFK